ncbi:uncharacterized protein LOC112600332 [Melanaphis sacchari]|uniref:uncharacterized protein LOC112600332 n=1 Tax=Melanaphis sacchari TaxID=742174 RepID=UPI000DC13324|nr:uncharacterized protein LOC112600332 [Melanaphis sacchari]XP_025203315.1 uncharacterized protein LOC112600332 [Melanaphis sacchari]
MPSASNDRLHIPGDNLENENPDNDEQIQMLQQLETSDSDTWSENDIPPGADGLSEDEDDDLPVNQPVSDNNSESQDAFSDSPSFMEIDEPSDTEILESIEAARGTTSNASAGRNRGRNVARRGRQRRHPTLHYIRTPFERGVTFNGFARNLIPERITGYMIERQSETILYYIKWRNDDNRIRLIESSLVRRYCPLLIVNYYEALMIHDHS